MDGQVSAARVRLFGPTYSVYTRIARLVLIEKGVDFTLVETDVFAAGGLPAEYLARQPFGKVPAFDHDGFALYETSAITRYIDRAFAGPPLMPGDPRAAARADQIIALMDSYAYRALVWDVFVERVRVPMAGGQPDDTKIAAGLARADQVLNELARLRGASTFLVGEALTLADLHVYPMLALFLSAPDGLKLIGRFPALARWIEQMARRASVGATRSPMEA
jgi:glutathione S-transferase